MVYNMVRMLKKLKTEANSQKQLFNEGVLEGKIEVAKKLLLAQVSMQSIAEFTGLPVEQLVNIKRDIS